MGKKKEDIHDYISAHDAAAILSVKRGSPVRADYISKMAKSKKHAIRVARFRDRWMYHQGDIEACTVGTQQPTRIAAPVQP